MQTPAQKAAQYQYRKFHGLCTRCGIKHGRQRVLCLDCAAKKELSRGKRAEQITQRSGASPV